MGLRERRDIRTGRQRYSKTARAGTTRSGDDKLYGGGNADVFGGNEYMHGGSGDDTLDFRYSYAEGYGGPGKDTLYPDNGLI